MHRLLDTHEASPPADAHGPHDKTAWVRMRGREVLPEATGVLVGTLLGATCWALLIIVVCVIAALS